MCLRPHSGNPGRLAVEPTASCLSFVRVKYGMFPNAGVEHGWIRDSAEGGQHGTPTLCQELSGSQRLRMVMEMTGMWGVEKAEGKPWDWESSCSQISPNWSCCGPFPTLQPVAVASVGPGSGGWGRGDVDL